MNSLEHCAACGEDGVGGEGLRPTKLRKFFLAPI